jgi:acetylglutamate kinase
LAELVRGDTPAHARQSVADLEREYAKAKTKAKKLAVARAVQQEANRLAVLSLRAGISEKEKQEAKVASEIFDSSAERLFRSYTKRYGPQHSVAAR